MRPRNSSNEKREMYKEKRKKTVRWKNFRIPSGYYEAFARLLSCDIYINATRHCNIIYIYYRCLRVIMYSGSFDYTMISVSLNSKFSSFTRTGKPFTRKINKKERKEMNKQRVTGL